MYGRGREDYRTVTWGFTGRVRPGVPAPEFGATQTPDLRKRIRLIDVRAPVTVPSTESRAMAAYLQPRVVFPETWPTVFQEASPVIYLVAHVYAGMGGISLLQTMRVPAAGLSLHLAADSLRVDIQYDPPNDLIAVENNFTLAGFDVTGGVSVSNTGPQSSRATTQPLPASSSEDVAIPAFSQTLQIWAPDPVVFQVEWIDQFGVVCLGTVAETGSSFVEPVPIPAHASIARVTNVTASAAPVATLDFRRSA